MKILVTERQHKVILEYSSGGDIIDTIIKKLFGNSLLDASSILSAAEKKLIYKNLSGLKLLDELSSLKNKFTDVDSFILNLKSSQNFRTSIFQFLEKNPEIFPNLETKILEELEKKDIIKSFIKSIQIGDSQLISKTKNLLLTTTTIDEKYLNRLIKKYKPSQFISRFGKTIPKKNIVQRTYQKLSDVKRIKKFTPFENKIYDYIKDWNKIDDRLKRYVSDFKSYYAAKNRELVYGSSLTDDEIARFLTKHYYQDIIPNLTGVYKNKILSHGTNNVVDLDVIDVTKNLGSNTGNKGLFGDGFYLTSSQWAASHYGRYTQPLILNKVQNPLYFKPNTGKYWYGWTDYENLSVEVSLDWNKLKDLGIPTEKLREISTTSYSNVAPELDKAWKQNSYKLAKKDLLNRLRTIGVEESKLKKIDDSFFTMKAENVDPAASFSPSGQKAMIDNLMKRNKNDIIVTSHNTGGKGLPKFPDAEVVVKQEKAGDVKSLFPKLELILNSDGKTIPRNFNSSNIHEMKSLLSILR